MLQFVTKQEKQHFLNTMVEWSHAKWTVFYCCYCQMTNSWIVERWSHRRDTSNVTRCPLETDPRLHDVGYWCKSKRCPCQGRDVTASASELPTTFSSKLSNYSGDFRSHVYPEMRSIIQNYKFFCVRVASDFQPQSSDLPYHPPHAFFGQGRFQLIHWMKPCCLILFSQYI